MTALEEVHLASIRADLPPPDHRQRPAWALEPNSDPRSLTMSVNRINMRSSLQVLLDLPAMFYVATFAAFCYGVGHVIGVPYGAQSMQLAPGLAAPVVARAMRRARKAVPGARAVSPA